MGAGVTQLVTARLSVHEVSGSTSTPVSTFPLIRVATALNTLKMKH